MVSVGSFTTGGKNSCVWPVRLAAFILINPEHCGGNLSHSLDQSPGGNDMLKARESRHR